MFRRAIAKAKPETDSVIAATPHARRRAFRARFVAAFTVARDRAACRAP
jgi:hypothetical protein